MGCRIISEVEMRNAEAGGVILWVLLSDLSINIHTKMMGVAAILMQDQGNKFPWDTNVGVCPWEKHFKVVFKLIFGKHLFYKHSGNQWAFGKRAQKYTVDYGHIALFFPP